MTDALEPRTEPADPDATLPSMTPVARVEGVSAPLTRPVPRPRASRARWAVALVVTLIVVIVAGAIAVVAGGGSRSIAPAYLPADTVLYVEARLDLPGDQRQQLGDLLARFPGFADQATLEAKLDQALDKLVKRATQDAYSYTGNIKSWFGGQVAVGVLSGSVPTATSPGAITGPPALLVASVSNRSNLPTQIDQASKDLAKELGVPVTIEDHGGTSVVTLGGGAKTPLENVAFAVTNDAVLAARDPKLVVDALDRKAGKSPSLAGAKAFEDALAGLAADRLGTLYVDGTALRSMLSRGAGLAATPGATDSLAGLPRSVVAELRVEQGNIVARTRATPPASATPSAARTSDLAGRVPADAALYAETHDVGAAWKSVITQLEKQPGFDANSQQIKTLEGLLGTSLPTYLDWTRDLALVVTLRDGQPDGGLVVTASDAAIARSRLTQLVTFLRLSTVQYPGAVSVTDQTYAGTTITTISLDLSALTRLGGAPNLGPISGPGPIGPLPSSLPIVPNASPPGPSSSLLPSIMSKVDLSYALKDDLLVIGLKDAFVKRVLDTTAETSLAKLPRFNEAVVAAGGPQSTGLIYVDLTAVRAAVENRIPAADRSKYDSDVKPYLAPFDRFVGVGGSEKDLQTATYLIIMK